MEGTSPDSRPQYVKDFEAKKEELKLRFPSLASLIEQYNSLIIEQVKLMWEIINRDPKKRVALHHFLLNGCLMKSILISETYLRELVENNHYTLRMILRAQFETWALLNYLLKNPNYIDVIILESRQEGSDNIVNVLTLIDHLDKDAPKGWTIRKDYDELSEMLHPNKKSHLAGLAFKEDESYEFAFSSRFHLREEQVKEYLTSNINVLQQIIIASAELEKYYFSKMPK